MRGELETGTDCYILTPSFSDRSSISFTFWLGWSTVGHWGPKPSVWSLFSLCWHPISNWLKLSVSWLYFCLTPTCFRLFTQVHLLIDGSVKGQYVTPFAMTPTKAFCLSLSSTTASSLLALHFLPVCTSICAPLIFRSFDSVYSRTSLVWLTRNSSYMCVCVCIYIYIYIYTHNYEWRNWYIKLEITMTRKSSTHLHVTYGALNSCFDLIRSHQVSTTGDRTK